MSAREAFGWAATFVVSFALLLLWAAPLWAVLFVVAVAVFFVATQLQPARRLKMTRQEVLDETFGGGSMAWLRLVLPLVGLGLAAIQGDGLFVVFGVLVVATLVLALLVFQILGPEFFGGRRRGEP